MHYIEPFYNWRGYYIASDDPISPFFNCDYSELQYSNKIYNFYIHPQWDNMGSETLFLKILYVDYDKSSAVIELIGEWNDAINNDIMTIKRDLIDLMIQHGIDKYILIGENVLNFHASDDCYYQEWFDDTEEGWIVALNFRDYIKEEFNKNSIDYYLVFGGELDEMLWRIHPPNELYERIVEIINHRLT